ncbi:MAG: hypothetical protein IJS90_03810, partial [Clostridia bacterium]|nr:hypothetical protein [Clostridia bacterium]
EVKDDTDSVITSFNLYLINIEYDNNAKGYIVPNYKICRDNYSFDNDGKVDWLYYTTSFGLQKGFELYNPRKTANGLCYGMSATNANILMDKPNVSSFNSNSIFNLSTNDYSKDLELYLYQYLRYAQIFQLTDISIDNRNQHKGSQNVYSYVSNAIGSNKPVVVDLLGSDRAGKDSYHAVMAVGIDGKDIIVCDPNDSMKLHRISINGDEWIYVAGGYVWGSSFKTEISYETLSPVIYDCLKSEDGIKWALQKNLLSGGENMQISSDSPLSKIIDMNNYESEDKLSNLNQYWVDAGSSITAKNNGDTSSNVSVTGEKFQVSVLLEQRETISASMGKSASGFENAYIQNTEGKTVSLISHQMDSEERITTLEITGTATETTVEVKETETGYIITGIKNVTGTITDENGSITKSKTLTSNTAYVEVSYDKSGKTDVLEIVSVDDQHGSVDDENICKFCGQVHEGFWGKFVGFFHKIAYFFAHLFGKM